MACYYVVLGKSYSKLSGLSWHYKWENICLLATAEGVLEKKTDVVVGGEEVGCCLLSFLCRWCEEDGCPRQSASGE